MSHVESFLFCSSLTSSQGLNPCSLFTTISIASLSYLLIVFVILYFQRRNQRILLSDDVIHLSPTLQRAVTAIGIVMALLALESLLDVLYLVSRVTVSTKGRILLPWITVLPAGLLFLANFIHVIDYFLYDEGYPTKWEFRTHGYWIFSFILAIVDVVQRTLYRRSQNVNTPWDEIALVSGLFASSIVRLCLLTILAFGGSTVTLASRQWISRGGYQSLESGTEKPETTWRQRLKILTPYLWPKDIVTRLLVLACFLLLGVGRVTNLWSPWNYKSIIDKLTQREWPVREIVIFVVLKLLQGGGGILSAAQDLLWLPLSQRTTRTISMQSFKHLHSLSTRFHLNKKTGEVIRAQNRGVSSIVSLLEIFLFRLGPMLLDTSLASIFFAIQFDLAFAGIVFGTALIYILASIKLTAWRMSHRKDMNQLDNAVEGRAVDSLLNHETVKLFANEDFEAREYEKAIEAYQKKEFHWDLIVYSTSFVQNLILQIGTLMGAIRCARQVIDGTLTVGDFVLFLSLAQQVFGNIGWIGGVYRQIQRNAVDCDQLVGLLAEEMEVKDAPNAKAMVASNGQVEFDDVSFGYDPRRTILNHVSFTIPAGTSLALVGESGSGKTTIGRLLIRLYDVTGGAVKIDGQDVRDVTQASLRRSIVGVVPQETPLFNKSVMENIRYGRIDATDDEVKEAAKVAQIYDRIESFPEKWETIVGERGMRLSGGERQRIGFARMALKAPSVLLLDESTSSLDSTTEKNLQESLQSLLQNRTALIIAHRLSTIVNCDQICVMSRGEIVERGSFHELMAIENGIFAKMWREQADVQQIEVKDPESRSITPDAPRIRGKGRGSM